MPKILADSERVHRDDQEEQSVTHEGLPKEKPHQAAGLTTCDCTMS